MTKKNTLACTLALLCAFHQVVFSQGKSEAHLGPAFPFFSFSDHNIETEGAGGASTGIGLGLKYSYPVSKTGFNIFAGIDLIYNGLNKDFMNNLKASIAGTYGQGAEIKPFSYLNIPIVLGTNYRFYSKNNIDFFAEMGLGMNILKKFRLKVVSGEIQYKENYNFSGKLAILTGITAIYKQKYPISLNFLMPEKHQIKGKKIMMGTSLDLNDEVQKVCFLSLTIGYLF